MLNTIIIGVGGQSQKDYLPFMTNSSRYNLVAICDKNEKLLNEISQQYNVPGFLSLGDLLKEINNVDVAIVAVPHNAYLGIIKELVANGIHIIKEKPFATSAQEAIEIHECMKSSNVLLGVAMKRRFSPVFKAFLEFKKKIGRIYLVEGCYVMNIKRLDEGWRASKNQSGGGALVDLGYHYIDLIVWYMGIPRTATARMSGKSRVGQEYDVEDTVSLMLDYASNDSDDSDQKTVVNLVISRNYPAKKEEIIAYGTDGRIELRKGQIKLFDSKGDEIECVDDDLSSTSENLLASFSDAIEGKSSDDWSYTEHLKHVSIIEAAYEADKLLTSCCPNKIFEKFFNDNNNMENVI